MLEKQQCLKWNEHLGAVMVAARPQVSCGCAHSPQPQQQHSVYCKAQG